MNRTRVAALSAAVVVVALLLFSSSLFVAAGSQTARAGKDVIMMRCNTTDADFTASGYKGNSGTPAKRSNSCSENISQLLKDGFVIQDIGHYDMEKAGYLVVTMTR